MTFLALGYLRTDVSQRQRRWDEAQIRSLARRLGYELSEIILAGTHEPIQRLMDTVIELNAEAVIVPTADHFDGHLVPAELIEITDVITVSPEHTYARWATGEVPRRE
ncbi:hypothetical protein [Nocardia spumae]|uniref:hypothetical protein n=1 Tax=Nocardia spumae TaxID=2887190 RepID=UPI001D14DA93|nr:hypothetical protein [Nocardia spumae]